MHDNSFYLMERFNKSLDKVGASSLFDKDDDGNLTVLVHNGRTIDTYRIVVGFPYNSVLISTYSCIGVEEENYEKVKNLLENLNEMVNVGAFFIGENSKCGVISFAVQLKIDTFESLENPFDAVFYGAEMIEKYTEAILKTLLGSNIYFIMG